VCPWPALHASAHARALWFTLHGWRLCRRCIERLQRKWPADAPEQPWLLPLHASLTPAEQSRVFAAPPAGHRKVVVSTNVAETSITVYVRRETPDLPNRCEHIADDHPPHWVMGATRRQAGRRPCHRQRPGQGGSCGGLGRALGRQRRDDVAGGDVDRAGQRAAAPRARRPCTARVRLAVPVPCDDRTHCLKGNGPQGGVAPTCAVFAIGCTPSGSTSAWRATSCRSCCGCLSNRPSCLYVPCTCRKRTRSAHADEDRPPFHAPLAVMQIKSLGYRRVTDLFDKARTAMRSAAGCVGTS